MPPLNLHFAWVWFLFGLLSGSLAGLRFHDDRWLGGYGQWRRRMVRLGHIAFFGTGLLNLAFALCAPKSGGPSALLAAVSVLLLVGAVGMPAVCFLCAWRKALRHMFAVPVASLLAGVGLFLVHLGRAGLPGAPGAAPP